MSEAREAIFNLGNFLSFSDEKKLRCPKGDADIYRVLGKDLMTCLFNKNDISQWDALTSTYRQAWFDEIKRRVRGRELCLLKNKDICDEARFALKKAALHGGSAMPSLLLFSQFKCNIHFQAAYDDSPKWIARESIGKVAEKLRQNNSLSVDFRISVSWIGRRWIAWNNRGFTAHCLANVMPMRIVPNPAPSVDERSRLGELVAQDLNYANAVPLDRRNPEAWESAAPCTVISVVEGGQGKEVLYTVKNGFQQDNGNATVLNSP